MGIAQRTSGFPHANASDWLHAAALGLLVAYLWPYWLQGQDAHLLVHDQLDSVFLSLKIIADSGLLFAHPDTIVPAIGEGITRASYPSAFFVVVWLFDLLGAFNGFVANQLLIRVLAYWGMFRLLRGHIAKDESQRMPAAMAALAFACLPHYSLFGLSIAGQPLFFSALLNIRARRDRGIDWLLCALFPLYSMLPLGGLFALAAAALLVAIDMLQSRPAYWRACAALALSAGVALLVEYQALMVLLGLAHGFQSHRSDFVLSARPVLDAAWEIFRYGQYHAPSLHDRVILPTALAALVLWGAQHCMSTYRERPLDTALVALTAGLLAGLYWVEATQARAALGALVLLLGLSASALALRVRRTAEPAIQWLLWALGAAALISTWYGAWPWLWTQIAHLVPNAPYVNLSRFHYLHPFLWGLVFAASLALLWPRWIFIGRVLCLGLFAVQANLLVHHAEASVAQRNGTPTYRAFVAAELFEEIKQSIGMQKSAVGLISLAIDPVIAAYNGVHTLDGYLANYPLAYKRAFRQIIQGELEQSPDQKKYFDEWGSRFYLTSKDIQGVRAGFVHLTRNEAMVRNLRVTHLRFNVEAFKALGGTHLISAVPIDNATEIGLKAMSVHESPGAAWRLHLYSAVTRPTGIPSESSRSDTNE